MTAKLSRRGVLATGLALAAGPVRAADPVRVGSKLDTEGGLLGHMIRLVFEANAIPTVNRIQLGTTRIVRQALLAGEIDIYPEYTGNGAFFFNVDSDPVWKHAGEAYQRVRKLDEDANKLIWLQPAPANNTWGIGVRRDVADSLKLATMEDFGRAVTAGKIKIAASAEFIESPAALPAFQTAYGFKLGANQALVLAGGDTAATIRATAEGTSGVNAGMVYGTDGAIAALGLVVMEDTKGAQMVYEPAPVLRASVLAAYPAIPGLLAPVFAGLDAPTLRSLNARVAVDGEDVAKVAASHLKAKGFVK
jgi:osmoprotectant transport system substrate-binding protein